MFISFKILTKLLTEPFVQMLSHLKIFFPLGSQKHLQSWGYQCLILGFFVCQMTSRHFKLIFNNIKQLYCNNSQHKSHVNCIVHLLIWVIIIHLCAVLLLPLLLTDPLAREEFAGVLLLASIQPGVQPREDTEVIVGRETGAQCAVLAVRGQRRGGRKWSHWVEGEVHQSC